MPPQPGMQALILVELMHTTNLAFPALPTAVAFLDKFYYSRDDPEAVQPGA